MLIQSKLGPATVEVMGSKYEFVPNEDGIAVAEVWVPRHLAAFLAVEHYEKVDTGEPEPGGPAILTGISPNTAVLGDPDVTVTYSGSGFTEDSVIVFAGQDEPIVFVSENEISTIVTLSLPWGAVTVPTFVRSADGIETEAHDFTFTEPVQLSQLADDDEDGDGVQIDVTRISGIGPALRTRLASAGITDVRQIAALDEDDASELDEQLELGGRVARDEWVKQARALIA